MSPYLFSIALAISEINPTIPSPQAQEYAVWVTEEAARHNLDPWLIVELVRRETHWDPLAIRTEDNGTCSVGLGQINGPCVRDRPPRWPSLRATFVREMLDPHANLRRTAEVLALKRGVCRRRCGDLGGYGWLRGYNPGDSSYAPAIVAAVKVHHPDLARRSGRRKK